MRDFNAGRTTTSYLWNPQGFKEGYDRGGQHKKAQVKNKKILILVLTEEYFSIASFILFLYNLLCCYMSRRICGCIICSTRDCILLSNLYSLIINKFDEMFTIEDCIKYVVLSMNLGNSVILIRLSPVYTVWIRV